MPRILLRSGTILVHGEDDKVTVLRNTDIAIEDSEIKAIGQNLEVLSNTEVFDCADKIISPGFIDTHHHLWQSQLKGVHAEHTLLDYFPNGNTQSHNFSTDDVYWGQLAGALEALDSGTTLVLDHAHICRTREHASRALSATCHSGIRSVFAYGVPVKFDRWDDQLCIPNGDLLPADLLDQCEELARQAPHGNGRVEIGFGFDFYFLPEPVITGLFQRFRSAGVKLFTSHVVKNPVFGLGSIIRNLRDYELISSPPDIVLSHCTGIDEEEKGILRSTGIPISSTPDTEAQMGMGWPLAFTRGINYTIGVDCHTNNTSSIMSLARSALQMARQRMNLSVIASGGFPETLHADAAAAFNAATIIAARAMRLDHQVGSIKVGKKADLVILNTSRSPGLGVVGKSDPLVATLRHSSVADIEAVLVDGIWRKKNYQLCPIEGASGEILNWPQIRSQLLVSLDEIRKRQELARIEPAVRTVRQLYQVDETKLMAIGKEI